MKRLIILLIVVVFFLAAGCSTTNSICENVPDGEISVLCIASNETGVSLENLSNTLVITNLAAIEADVYTAQEAFDFIDNAEKLLKSFEGGAGTFLTYNDVVRYLVKEYHLLSPAAQAVFIVIDPLSSLVSRDMPKVLSDFDINLLLKHLEKQKAIVSSYL